jgi:hypothetical protein
MDSKAIHPIEAHDASTSRQRPTITRGALGFPLFAFVRYRLLVAMAASVSMGQDFSDPADIIKYFHSRQQSPGQKSTLPEIDGKIQNCTTAKPGWYGVTLDLENGKQLHVIVAPSTKFYKDYKPLDSNAAYPQLHQGQKIRALHNPETDEALRNIIITDLMFETPPPEIDGTIRSVSNTKAGSYSLALALEKGGQVQMVVDPQTKFYVDYKPMEAAAAYARLIAGQKVRILQKSTAADSPIADLMFVDR